MIFTETGLAGAFVIEIQPIEDERGFFGRTWSADEFRLRGLDSELTECSIAWNVKRGTLRGMHFSTPAHAQAKLVRCTAGAIYDVIIDLRPGSSTENGWFGVELSAENRRLVYIPRGFAHGYLTLVGGAEVSYQMSGAFEPDAVRGVRWSDPAFGIVWPEQPTTMLPRDASYPFLTSLARDHDVGGAVVDAPDKKPSFGRPDA